MLLVIVIAPLSFSPTNPPECKDKYEDEDEDVTSPVFVLLVISTAEVLIPTNPPQHVFPQPEAEILPVFVLSVMFTEYTELFLPIIPPATAELLSFFIFRFALFENVPSTNPSL